MGRVGRMMMGQKRTQTVNDQRALRERSRRTLKEQNGKQNRCLSV